jgi:ribosome assembly protein YihI (activator of Der GTPase)
MIELGKEIQDYLDEAYDRIKDDLMEDKNDCE